METYMTIEEAKAAMLPYESWERLSGESSSAFAAFCAYRDFGLERNIRKAVDSAEKDDKAIKSRKGILIFDISREGSIILLRQQQSRPAWIVGRLCLLSENWDYFYGVACYAQ